MFSAICFACNTKFGFDTQTNLLKLSQKLLGFFLLFFICPDVDIYALFSFQLASRLLHGKKWNWIIFLDIAYIYRRSKRVCLCLYFLAYLLFLQPAFISGVSLSLLLFHTHSDQMPARGGEPATPSLLQTQIKINIVNDLNYNCWQFLLEFGPECFFNPQKWSMEQLSCKQVFTFCKFSGF